MKSSYVISLGGMCNIAYSCRSFSKTQDAFPFDFIRTTFEGVCFFISNDFKDFTNFEYKRIPFQDTMIYFDDKHAFVHHDITKKDQQDAFRRRCDRFIKICESEDYVTFARIITAENVWDELCLIDTFNKIMKKRYPLLNYELYLIIDANTEHIDELYTVYEKTKLFRCNVTSEVGSGKHISSHLSEILLNRPSKLVDDNVTRFKHWNTVCGI